MKKSATFIIFITLFFACINSRAQQVLHATGGAVITVQSGAGLYVNGSISLANTSTLNNAGTVTINRQGGNAADFSDLSVTPYFYGTGSFVFSGSGIQNVRGGTFYDMVINNTAEVTLLNEININNNLNLLNGSLSINDKKLTLSGAVTGPGFIKGSAQSNLHIGGAAGVLNFDQANAASRSLKDLTMSGAATSATLGNNLQIYGLLGLQACSFDLNGKNLLLKSTGNGFNGTARVGNLTGSTLTGATNVTVERFIDNPKRSWHLLSAKAVTGTQTIRQAWQENGGAIIAGEGTLVTSNLYNGSNGFDMASISSSVLTHNQGGFAGPSWNFNLTNTNTTILSSHPGYMLFVRGDRNYTPANGPSTSSTVLKTNGTLTQGNQSAFISSAGTGRTLVANPYASPIDMEPLFASTANLAQDMYIWDADLTGNYSVGGYRIVERTGAETYQQTPVVLGGGPTPDAAARYIHSGQAFFLRTIGTAGATDATVNFTESIKASSVSTVNPIVSSQNDQQLVTNLIVVNPDNSVYLADGFRIRYDSSYQSNISDDIEKMGNFGENISSLRQGKRLIVERRPMIVASDTIFIRLGNTAIKNYRFQIGSLNFIQAGVVAFLEDAYTNNRSLLDLSGNINEINFNITADAASANIDRFKIVFTAAGPLPVTITSVKASQQNEHILVEWKVSNQQNIKHYEVERSADGINFNQKAIVTATGNTNGDVAYAWKDIDPIKGYNFYRIRSVGIGADVKLSEIVKVLISSQQPGIVVYPNPVINQKIQLRVTGESGVYRLRLINSAGQVVLAQQINHGGGIGILSIATGNISAGRYFLEIENPDRIKLVKDIFVTND